MRSQIKRTLPGLHPMNALGENSGVAGIQELQNGETDFGFTNPSKFMHSKLPWFTPSENSELLRSADAELRSHFHVFRDPCILKECLDTFFFSAGPARRGAW